MKMLRSLLVTIIAVSALSVTAQTQKETIKVLGNCEACKARIEKAAKTAGATAAKWDMESQSLTVSFNSATTSIKNIVEKVASSGHDKKNILAKSQGHNNLPECCRYERKEGGRAAKSCCQPGASCCTGSEACCSQKSKATATKEDCCTAGSSCCSAGQACCSKS